MSAAGTHISPALLSSNDKLKSKWEKVRENFQRIWTKLRHHRHGGTSASTTQLWHRPGPITAEKKAESSQDRVLADTSPSLQNPGTLFLQLSLVPLKMVARKFPWRTITLGFLHFLEIWFGKGKGFSDFGLDIAPLAWCCVAGGNYISRVFNFIEVVSSFWLFYTVFPRFFVFRFMPTDIELLIFQYCRG